jgi:hypothetical protein
MDYLVPNSSHRNWWCAAAAAVTSIQCGATDMTYYSTQSYDPAPITAIYEKVRSAGAVPPISRVADPWLVNDNVSRAYTSRNDAVIDGTSDFPCYEPVFGYRMQAFIQGRLAPGPILAMRTGLPNLKNPVCYVFPKENNCRPGDEFTSEQSSSAQLFANYRPFPYIWPARQYVAASVGVSAGAVCLIVLIMSGLRFFFFRFQRRG